ncbi:MAG: bifunctional enoyl-CoA hydratase/phosphate acetyltransferase [Treponema sp.]|nr:bifunctional enoyl-CoA hydratase/phosphate acetyltransferase [Treponema sp.]
MKSIAEIIEAAQRRRGAPDGPAAGSGGSAGRAAGGQRPAPPRIAVAAAQDERVLESLSAARERGLGEPVLVGDRRMIRNIASRLRLDLGGLEIFHETDRAAAVRTAIELVRDGKAGTAMKGQVETAVFLRWVVKKDMGLNTGRLISHLGVIESPFYHKLLFLSDGALNIAPSLEDKIGIIENAVSLVRSLGLRRPKVALLAALEQVNPGRMPCTADAAVLTQMNRRGRFPGCIIDGPLALDNALHGGSAKIKGIDSPVAGDADILIAPSIEAGNILYKALVYLGKARSAGIILGTRVPVILTSRAADAETRLASIALGTLTGAVSAAAGSRGR